MRGKAGPEWLHEIKHDGYRMLALHDGERARLISRRGLDWAWRFPMIVAAIKALAVRSCIVELIACDANGRADFQLLRWRQYPRSFAIPRTQTQNASSRLMLVLRPAMTTERLTIVDFMIVTPRWQKEANNMPRLSRQNCDRTHGIR